MLYERWCTVHEEAYYEEYDPWRRSVWELVMGQDFEMFIGAVILLNVVVMASEHYQMSYEYLKVTYSSPECLVLSFYS